MAAKTASKKPAGERLPPVIALVGDDVFLQLEALHAVIAALPAGTTRVDVDGASAPLADVLDELRSFSMFSQHKLVVVRDADDFVSDHREHVEDYVAAPSNSATLVLRFDSLPGNQRVAKLIKQHGRVDECAAPKQNELPRWIERRTRDAHDATIELPVAQTLANLIGADLGRLDNELAKLAINAGPGGTIDEAAVRASVAFQRDQEMWTLTDDLTRGRPDDALRRWRQLLHGDPSTEFRATTWLTMWLEKAIKGLRLRQERKDAFAIAKELKIWPASNAEPLLRTAEQMGPRRLTEALDLLTELDYRSKSGRGEAADNVERFILSLAKGK